MCIISPALSLTIVMQLQVGWRGCPGAELEYYPGTVVCSGAKKPPLERLLNQCVKRDRWFSDTDYEGAGRNKVGLLTNDYPYSVAVN